MEILGVSKEAVRDLIRRRNIARAARRGRPPKHSAKAELVVTLVHLRQFPTDAFLASVVFMRKSSIQYLRETVVAWLERELGPAISPRDKSFRQSRGAHFYSQLFTFAVDGSEQPTSRSSNPILDTAYYSTKKKQHSINIVAIVTLDGFLLWLSQSYPGGTADRKIVEDETEWCSIFDPDEHGFADSGFNGLENFNLMMPPSTKNALHNLHSSRRIIIENLFSRLKKFRALHEPLRIPLSRRTDLMHAHHRYWVVVGGLYNTFLWPQYSKSSQ